MDTILEVVAGGVSYTGWNDVSISRSLDECCSSFSLTCPERFAIENLPVPFAPFTPLVLRANGQVLLTGYSFGYGSSFGPGKHEAKITGRSKTAQLVDCTPDIPAGQYQGYTLAAIAPSVCNIFDLAAKVETDLTSAVLADSTLERGETGFKFIDRLATICGVLAYDDETGALVLNNAGSARAVGALVQGGDNSIIEASVKNNGEERFSIYIVKGQSGIAAAAGSSGFPSGSLSDHQGDGDSDPADDSNPALITPTTGEVLTQQRATSIDPGVPLYRPKIILAEGQLNQAQLQLRADWQRSFHYGHSISVDVTVPGWFQPDGTPWRVNTLVPVNIPYFGINQDLLILKVEWSYSLSSGHRTVLTVGPVDGAIPSPSLLKTRRKKGKKGGSFDFDGINS